MNKKGSQVKIWQILRRFPFIVAVFACMGIGFGYGMTFVLHDDNRAKENVMHVLGIICLIFYSGLLVWWISKMLNKSWTTFCDRTIDRVIVLENKRLQTRRLGRELKIQGRPLLVLSLIILAVAALDNYVPLTNNWRGINAAAILCVMFLAPTFLILAGWDIFKGSFSWSRLMALVCSALAIVLLVVKMNNLIHTVAG